MILTVTLNPAVDISYNLNDFKINATNRCHKTIKTAGGKGLNVARVLKQLNTDVLTTGFLGGELGDFIKNELDRQDIANDFLMIDKPTRNCIAILNGNSQTEILESGPTIEQAEQTLFLEKYQQLCEKVNIVTISGSTPKGIKTQFIERLIKIAVNKKCKVIADVSGQLLKEIINQFKIKPDIIKPNLDELQQLLNMPTNVDIKTTLLKNTADISNVMLTCGADGAYFKTNNKVYKIDIPKVKCINPVGSGDSTVAGLAYALDKKMPFEKAITLATACGISNCMHEQTGYIDTKYIYSIENAIKISKI